MMLEKKAFQLERSSQGLKSIAEHLGTPPGFVDIRELSRKPMMGLRLLGTAGSADDQPADGVASTQLVLTLESEGLYEVVIAHHTLEKTQTTGAATRSLSKYEMKIQVLPRSGAQEPEAAPQGLGFLLQLGETPKPNIFELPVNQPLLLPLCLANTSKLSVYESGPIGIRVQSIHP